MTTIGVRVESIRESPGGVRELTFAPDSGDPLPPFSPGSHVIVHLPGEPAVQNAYSLASAPSPESGYRIAVRLEENGRGGSRRLHEQVAEGDLLQIEPPRNLFAPQALARGYLLVAGGIGVTPFVSWLHHLRAAGTPAELIHCGRPDGSAALLAELEELAPGAITRCGNRTELLSALDEALGRQPLGTHLATCGPAPMMDAVLAAAAARGWPPERVHLERFSAEEGPMEPFDAVLGEGGGRLRVSASETLLEALEKSGRELPYRCRQGVCGECALGLLGGTPDHRDTYLSAEERQAGRQIMPCVSRCAGGELVLDLR